VEVLQPGVDGGFASEDEEHCMLPSGAALYRFEETQPTSPVPLTAAAISGASGGATLAPAGDCPASTHSLRDALLAFMNSPHPLQIMSDVRSYGASGRISRFHNPKNYSAALRALL